MNRGENFDASAAQSTVPKLTLSQDARLYKYVRLPSGWKYLRADYSENFGVKPHPVFLPKTKTATIIEGGKYVASDDSKWHPLSADPNEAWTLFKLYCNEGRKSQLEVKSQQLRQQLATGQKAVVKEEEPKAFTVGDTIGNFLKSFRLKILSGGRKPRTYDAIVGRRFFECNGRSAVARAWLAQTTVSKTLKYALPPEDR